MIAFYAKPLLCPKSRLVPDNFGVEIDLLPHCLMSIINSNFGAVTIRTFTGILSCRKSQKVLSCHKLHRVPPIQLT